jgi:carbonyl reductase 1
VTGSNKGIGYGIVRVLCQKEKDAIIYMTGKIIKIFNKIIIMFSFTARNPKLGEAALEQLKKEVDTASHARVHLHQLDITDKQSCNTLAQYLKQKYGGLDVLVNNAGILVV